MAPPSCRHVALLAPGTGEGERERSVLELAAGLPATWRPSLWLAQAGGLERAARARGLPVAPFRWAPSEGSGPWRALAEAVGLAGAFRRHAVDLVHLTDTRGAIPVIAAARLLGRPCVVDAHHPIAGTGRQRAALALADAVVLPSPTQRARAGWARAHVVAEGTPIPATASGQARELARQRWGARADETLVGQLGPLTPWAGCDLAVEAVAALRRRGLAVRLVFLGEDTEWAGRYHTLLVSLAAGLDAAAGVTFAKPDASSEPAAAGLDVLVCPARRNPAVRGVLAAMAAGVPVVAARVGEIPDVVRDGEDGLLVPPESVEEVGRALTALVQDPSRRRRMGDSDRRRASATFSQEERVRRIVALYETVSAPYLSLGAGRAPRAAASPVDDVEASGGPSWTSWR